MTVLPLEERHACGQLFPLYTSALLCTAQRLRIGHEPLYGTDDRSVHGVLVHLVRRQHVSVVEPERRIVGPRIDVDRVTAAEEFVQHRGAPFRIELTYLVTITLRQAIHDYQRILAAAGTPRDGDLTATN